MRVGLLADSHDDRERLQAALRELERRDVELLLHAGDLASGRVLDLLADWQVYLAQGNADWAERIEAAIDETGAEVRFADRHAIEAGDKRIGLVHGHYDGRLRSMIASGAYDVVVHGHTHEFRDETIDGVRVVNPGALHRTPTPSFCVYDTEADELERIEL